MKTFTALLFALVAILEVNAFWHPDASSTSNSGNEKGRSTSVDTVDATKTRYFGKRALKGEPQKRSDPQVNAMDDPSKHRLRAGCEEIPYYFYLKDLTSETNKIPLYSTETDEQFGTLAYTQIEVPNDCLGYAVASFGPEDAPTSQLSFSYTCTGPRKSVIGGNGQYGCATGYEEQTITDEDAYKYTGTVYVCGKLCPVPPMPPMRV